MLVGCRVGAALARRRLRVEEASRSLARGVASSVAVSFRAPSRTPLGARDRVGSISARSRRHLVAVVVRLEFLFQPMRYDESVTYVHYASRPWYIALTTYRRQQPRSPFGLVT